MSAPDPLDQLRKLAALKDEGVIDAEEFRRTKAELLARAVGDSGDSPTLIGERPPVPLEASRPGGGPIAWHAAAVRVTEPEVAQSQQRLSKIEQQFEQLTKAHETLLDRLSDTRRRIWHFTFLQNARRMFHDFAFGRIAPVMVTTALGLLLGVVIVGILPLPTGFVLAGGLLGLGAALLASLYMFAVPRDEVVAERLAAYQHEWIQLQSQVPQVESEVNDAKASLDEAQRQHLELTQKFDSRLNQLLTFDWRTLKKIPFEKFLRAIFEEQGYQVRSMKPSGDNDLDLIIEKDNVRIAAVVKGYTEHIGTAAVDAAHAGMKAHRCNLCAVVTNGKFTKPAIDRAARLDCPLIDGSQIEALILGEIRL